MIITVPMTLVLYFYFIFFLKLAPWYFFKNNFSKPGAVKQHITFIILLPILAYCHYFLCMAKPLLYISHTLLCYSFPPASFTISHFSTHFFFFIYLFCSVSFIFKLPTWNRCKLPQPWPTLMAAALLVPVGICPLLRLCCWMEKIVLLCLWTQITTFPTTPSLE